MSHPLSPLIDESGLALAQRELGEALPRILGYFREDGAGSVGAIEAAMHNHDAAAMVRPAHTMKSEARQFGGEALADLSQHLEMTARRCIEERVPLPDDLLDDVHSMRSLFQDTIAFLARVIDGADISTDTEQPVQEQHPAPTSYQSYVPHPVHRPIPGVRPVFGRRVTH